MNDLYLVNEIDFNLNEKSFDHLESISKIYFNESIFIFNGSKYTCFFINSMTRKIQRNIGNKYIFYKSLNLITPSPPFSVNKNWCEIIFHFLQFKIHFNRLTDDEFEFFFKNCQEYLTGKTNGYKYFLKKCLNKFDLVTNENKEFNETITNQFFTNFLYLIINIFLILIVALPILLLSQSHLKKGYSSPNEINNKRDIPTIAFSNIKLQRQISTDLVKTINIKYSDEFPETV